MSEKVEALREQLKEVVLLATLGFHKVASEVLTQRRTATPKVVLFADLSGSTEGGKKQPIITFLDTLAHHFAHSVALHLVKQDGGNDVVTSKIVKTVGDEVILTYEPLSGEPEAVSLAVTRVLLAALLTRDELEGSERRIKTKVGIHLLSEYVNPQNVLSRVDLDSIWKQGTRNLPTPEASSFFSPDDVIGHDMNLAARVAQAASAGQVLLSKIAYKKLLVEHRKDEELKLCFSPEIRFQDWKGIVSPDDLYSMSGYDDNDLMRTVFLVGLEGSMDAGRNGHSLGYRWPFHSLTLLAKDKKSGLGLIDLISHRELRNNLLWVGAVRQEHRLFLESEDKVANGRVDDWIKSKETPSDFTGIARFCASSFVTYNRIIRTFILNEHGSSAITYSYPVQTDSNLHLQPATTKVEQCLQQQPKGIEWSKAVSEGPESLCILLRAMSVEASERVLNDFARQPETVDCGLLYGEWDLFAIVKGDTALAKVKDVIDKRRAELRIGGKVESGLILSFQEMTCG